MFLTKWLQSRKTLIILSLLSMTQLSCGVGNAGDFSVVRSLTNNSFSGKKYYLGWGVASASDPAFMKNQVKNDVVHTHEVFSQANGGSYTAIKEITGNVNKTKIQNHWKTIGQTIGPNDMYLQYSSGHGFPQGLALGLSYDQIRDNALSYKAKETIVLLMACHSGGLISSFKRKQAEIEAMAAQGKTVFVMSSSSLQDKSATGPNASGSAFGYVLWKGLSGEADGFVDGIKDGFIDLSEIEAYTVRKTYELSKRLGGYVHTPVAYGYNYQNLIMNAVAGGGVWSAQTDEPSDQQLLQSLVEYDRAVESNNL